MGFTGSRSVFHPPLNKKAFAWFLRKSTLSCFLLLTLILSGCDSLEQVESFLQTSTPNPADATLAPTLSQTVTPQNQPTPTGTVDPADLQQLTIWVPPQMAPSAGNSAGSLLQSRLDQFSSKNPGLHIIVRVKALTGPGGLLESLSAASAAAPRAVPSLILLSRSDLESAALKGLIYSIDGLSKAAKDPDWYAYARQLSMVEGSTFGLPMAGDAMLLLYRPAKITTVPTDWAGLLSKGQPLVFAAEDPNAFLTLALYQSLGGKIEDDQHRPVLQPDTLATVLKLYSNGAQSGVFPFWLAQYQNDSQAWQAYSDQRAQWLVTWASAYLQQLPADTSAMPLPSLGSNSFTLADGWLIALSDPIPERRPVSIRLAEYLVDSKFLADWSAAANYLPTRPTSLAAWSNQSQRGLLSQIVLSAQVRPPNDILSALGPVLDDATLQVLKHQTDPIQAAQAAAERLTSP
jgi:multiple sugar transport system substrate-binding protein